MENTNVEKRGVTAVGMAFRDKTKPSSTEFAEAFLEGLKRTQATGTYLVSYRNGRPVLIRSVNNLQ